MSDLKLVVDSEDVEFPGPICEILKHRQHPVRATVTPCNYCIFICNNILYIFPNEATDNMRMVKLSLPSAAGIQYTTNLVCLFNKRNSKSTHPCVIAASPTGIIRYWSDPSKPYKDLDLKLNNQVALSLSLVESQDHVDRFLFSTNSLTTFYFVEVYHNKTENESDVLSHQHIDISSSSSIGRRVSMMLFGGATGRNSNAVKSMFVSNKLRSNLVDVVVVLPQSLQFISLQNGQFIQEKNIVDDAIVEIRKHPGNEDVKSTQIEILDAEVYSKGILMLIAVKHVNPSDSRFVKADFYISYLLEKRSGSGEYASMHTQLYLPEQIVHMETSKLHDCKLIVPNENECVIVFMRSVVVIYKPTSKKMDASILEDMNSYTLGAAAVNGKCFVLLRDQGVCVLRRLPRDFDSDVSSKYRGRLQLALEDRKFSNDIFKKAFVAFLNKDLENAKALANKLLTKNVNISDLAVEFNEHFMDVPPDELRWSSDKYLLTKDQKSSLKKSDDLKNIQLVHGNVLEKLRFHHMFVLFLRFCGLFEKMNSLEKTDDRSAVSQLVEMVEKFYVALTIVGCVISKIHGNSITRDSILLKSIRALSSEFTRRFSHPKNEFLTPFDHVFREVSHIDELIDAILMEGDAAYTSVRTNSERLAKLRETGDIIVMLADAMKLARKDDLSVIVGEHGSLWLQKLLPRIIEHFELAMELLITLGDNRHQISHAGPVLNHCESIASLILSQQSDEERKNSQIIGSFINLGESRTAVELAETYYDFDTLIKYCHDHLDEAECRNKLNDYKEKFADQDFELYLFGYYQKNGMVNYLLEDNSQRVNEFLADHKSINWIRNINSGEYGKAYEILRGMVTDSPDNDKRLILLALCKLCLLSQDDSSHQLDKIAEVGHAITLLIDEFDGDEVME